MKNNILYFILGVALTIFIFQFGIKDNNFDTSLHYENVIHDYKPYASNRPLNILVESEGSNHSLYDYNRFYISGYFDNKTLFNTTTEKNKILISTKKCMYVDMEIMYHSGILSYRHNKSNFVDYTKEQIKSCAITFLNIVHDKVFFDKQYKDRTINI